MEETAARIVPNILSLAGVDPSGGAGLLADIKTIQRAWRLCLRRGDGAHCSEYAGRKRGPDHERRLCFGSDGIRAFRYPD